MVIAANASSSAFPDLHIDLRADIRQHLLGQCERRSICPDVVGQQCESVVSRRAPPVEFNGSQEQGSEVTALTFLGYPVHRFVEHR